jgi:hypothetical protein
MSVATQGVSKTSHEQSGALPVRGKTSNHGFDRPRRRRGSTGDKVSLGIEVTTLLRRPGVVCHINNETDELIQRYSDG